MLLLLASIVLLLWLCWQLLNIDIAPVAGLISAFDHAHNVYKCAEFLKKKMQQTSKELVTLKGANHAFGLARLKGTQKLDLSALNKVIGMEQDGSVSFGASCTIEELLGYLQVGHNRTLPVIPDMKHLVMGGIVSGIGGGSGSWREGAFHDAVIDCDVLLADGSVVTKCSPDYHPELFYALPGSLGTLGYLTRMRMRTIPIHNYVHTRNIRCSTLAEFLRLVQTEGERADFVDGTAFAPDHLVCVLGYKDNSRRGRPLDNFVNHRIYWKALRDTEKESRHCTRLMDYIYRWETDLYYTSANGSVPSILKVEALRKWIPRRAIPWIKELAAKVHPVNIDNVCADIMIPVPKAEDFYRFYCREIRLFPLYLCPARSRADRCATFWTGEPLLDFGVAYGVLPGSPEKQLRYRTLMESEMLKLGGRKLPYSRQGLSRKGFWATRGGPKAREHYDRLRNKYRATHRFPDVFEKLR